MIGRMTHQPTETIIAKEVMPAKREINRIIHKNKREGKACAVDVDKAGKTRQVRG